MFSLDRINDCDIFKGNRKISMHGIVFPDKEINIFLIIFSTLCFWAALSKIQQFFHKFLRFFFHFHVALITVIVVLIVLGILLYKKEAPWIWIFYFACVFLCYLKICFLFGGKIELFLYLNFSRDLEKVSYCSVEERRGGETSVGWLYFS